jgi:hypothetical protein
MRDHRAAIPVARVLAVHPAVPLPPLHLAALHLRDQVLQSHLVQIASVVVKIYRLVAVHLIALVLLVKYRKGVKPAIHAGFVLSLWNAINQDFVQEFSNQIFLKRLQVKS